jgi:hypothetical protein
MDQIRVKMDKLWIKQVSRCLILKLYLKICSRG